MDTTKVFTGFDIDGNELLIYRENKNSYIDLIAEEKILKDDIDLETLRYLRDTVKILRYMPEELIRKLYKIDREKTFKSEDIIVGIKNTVTSLKTTKSKSVFYLYGVPMFNYHYSWNEKNREYGLYIYHKEFVLDTNYKYKLYKNFSDGKVYFGFEENYKDISQLPEFGNNMEYVDLRGNLQYSLKETIVEKRLIYEYANELRKEKID